ncbi:MAG: hypothetical protein IT383_22675 [Deltaproteobacteria bacterium]|nr:hypothetical protein [Deltaproteobacteria bacterium]
MRPALTLTVVVLALAASAARAQDFVGARALALGEAYRANATGNDAIYMNPAGLVLLPRFATELHYKIDLEAEQHQLDLSLVDSKTSELAAGIGYTFDGQQFTKRSSLQHTATLALAYPFFGRVLNVGAGLKYVNVSDAVLGNYLNALSADVGVLAALPFGVSLAGVGYNLIPIKSARVPLAAGFGASIDLGPLSALLFGGAPAPNGGMSAAGLPMSRGLELVGPLSGLTLELDWHLSFLTLYGIQSRVSTGLEYLLFEVVPLRAAWLYDEAGDDHILSAGAGFIVPYFGLDVAYQQSVTHPEHRVFAASIKVFLPL